MTLLHAQVSYNGSSYLSLLHICLQPTSSPSTNPTATPISQVILEYHCVTHLFHVAASTQTLTSFAKQPTDGPTDAPSFTPTSGAPTSEPTEVDIGLLEDGTFNCTSPAISKNDCKNAPYCEWDKNSCFDVTAEPTTSPSETPTKFPSELPTSSPLSSPPTLRPSELPTSSQVKIIDSFMVTMCFSFY